MPQPTVIADCTLFSDSPEKGLYRTLNGAVQACPRGGEVVVKGGVYAESFTYQQTPRGPRSCALYVPRPMTIRVGHGEQAVVTFDPGDPPRTEGPVRWLNYLVYFASRMPLNPDGTLGEVVLDGSPGSLTFVGARELGDNVGGPDTDVGVEVPGNLQAALTLRGIDVVAAGHCGIKVESGALAQPVLIEDCVVRGCGFTGRDHGLYLTQADNAPKAVRDCLVTGCSGFGIHLYSQPRGWEVSDCNVSGNGHGGVVLAGSRHRLVHNSVVNNRGVANLFLFHYGLQDLEVTDNVFSGGAALDVRVDGELGAGNTLRRNAFRSASPLWARAHGDPLPVPPGCRL